MAAGTLRREYFCSRGGIANEHVQLDRRSRRRGALSGRTCEHAVNVGGDRGHVVRRQPGGSQPILVRSLNDGSQQLALAVVEHHRRTKKVRTTPLAASQIGAVAAPALEIVGGTPACDD